MIVQRPRARVVSSLIGGMRLLLADCYVLTILSESVQRVPSSTFKDFYRVRFFVREFKGFRCVAVSFDSHELLGHCPRDAFSVNRQKISRQLIPIR